MNNDNKFFNGFLLGAIVGGVAVFLLGTKTGKNLLKIVSEQGLEGFTNLLEEYDLASIEEEEENLTTYQEEPIEEIKTNGHAKNPTNNRQEVLEESPAKRRFFKRVRK